MEESATGHCVIDLTPGCADLFADDSARGKTSGSVRRPRDASVKDSDTAVENSEFSNLILDVECACVRACVVECGGWGEKGGV